MVCSNLTKKQKKESSLLTPVDLTTVTLPVHQPNLTYTNPTNEIDFNGDYMTEDLNRFQLKMTQCSSCCPTIKHFADSAPAVDKIIEQNIEFIQNEESIMSDPMKQLKLPIFDPSNIGCDLSPTRPCGIVATRRIQTDIQTKDEFKRIALASAVSIIKSLQNKPQSVKEVNYKI